MIEYIGLYNRRNNLKKKIENFCCGFFSIFTSIFFLKYCFCVFIPSCLRFRNSAKHPENTPLSLRNSDRRIYAYASIRVDAFMLMRRSTDFEKKKCFRIGRH